MTIQHAALISAIILLCIITQVSTAEDQNVSISKSLDLWNEEPCTAVNTKTGDVLVVWCWLDQGNRTNSKIYAALCKLQGDGSFKIGKARHISGKNDTCSRPFVAFSSESGTFLVAWEIDKTTTGALRADIQARVVNAKGRTAGGIVNILPTSDRLEYRAVLAAVPQSVRTVVPDAVFLMSWQITPQDPSGYAKHAGLWTVLLDEKGEEAAPPKRVMKMDYKPNSYELGETRPHRIITTGKVPFYLTMINTRLSGDERVQETYLVKLDNKGGYSGKVLLDGGQQPIDTTAAMLSKRRLLVSWYNYKEYQSHNQLLKTSLKKVKKTYAPISGKSSTSELIGLADGGAFQIITTHPDFHTVRFNSKGKMLGRPEKHTPVSIVAGSFMAVEIPGMNKVLMAWKRIKDRSNAEIIGTLIAID